MENQNFINYIFSSHDDQVVGVEVSGVVSRFGCLIVGSNNIGTFSLNLLYCMFSL